MKAASRAGAVRRSRMYVRSSCVCTRAQHHSLSRRLSLRAASRAGAARVCGLARRHAILYARGAHRRNAIFEHDSPVLSLDKPGHASDPRNLDARARPGKPGGAGRGALISSGGAKPCNPCTSRGPATHSQDRPDRTSSPVASLHLGPVLAISAWRALFTLLTRLSSFPLLISLSHF